MFSHSDMSDSLWPHGLQHTRLPCPLLSPGVCSNSCLLSPWCHPTIWVKRDDLCICSEGAWRGLKIKNKNDFTLRNPDRLPWSFSWSFYSANPLNTSSSGFLLEAKIFESVPVTRHQLLNIRKSQLAVRWFDGVFLALKNIKMIGLAIPIMI